MLFGNLLAIPQRSVKRMLAYSAIAHAGYLLVAVASMASASPRPDATQGLLFYLASYAATVIGAFGVVAIIERRLALSGVGDDLSSWSGLSDRHPGLAAAMSLFMVSLAGIPPTAGFMAKVGVFSAAIRAGHWSLALIGLLSSVVAAFFYLRVLVLMYMQEPVGELDEDRAVLPRIAIAVPAALTLVLGIFPGVALGVLDKASVLRW